MWVKFSYIPMIKKYYNLNTVTNQQHPFHLVKQSPWPFFTSIAVLQLILSFVMVLRDNPAGVFTTSIGIFFMVFCLYNWFSDIIIESRSHHTFQVRAGLAMGMKLFIISEIMFFFAFFWAFFYSAISPSIWIGGVWPPKGINPLNPWGLPLLNTVLLLSSGVSLTWAHKSFQSGHRYIVIRGLCLTVLLGFLFTLCQVYEYKLADFTINDGIYGSVFYLATGFHGFHVVMGTILLLVCLIRILRNHFSRTHHLGFECAAWYWHFVDVVWIFLWLWIYLWGS